MRDLTIKHHQHGHLGFQRVNFVGDTDVHTIAPIYLGLGTNTSTQQYIQENIQKQWQNNHSSLVWKENKWCILSEEFVLNNVGEKNNLFHNM